MENRKITYRLYPSPTQREKLADMLGQHQRLYNAALEERITAYGRCGVSVGYVQQQGTDTAPGRR